MSHGYPTPVTFLEGMEGLEVSSLEGTVAQEMEALVVATVAKDHSAVMTEDVDTAMGVTEVEAEAEAHLDRRHQARGPATRIGMIGIPSVAMVSSTNKAKSLMRKLPRVLSISTPAYQVVWHGARKCETT